MASSSRQHDVTTTAQQVADIFMNSQSNTERDIHSENSLLECGMECGLECEMECGMKCGMECGSTAMLP